jgi:alpha-tubulin suppressor-like RCC1 family protein
VPLETTTGPPRTTPAFVWGYNNRGGLGLRHTARIRSPAPVGLPEGTVDVQGGVNFTVALTSAGGLYAWGGNQYGQLGDGTTAMRWEPATVKLPGGTRVTAIAVGYDHVIARTSEGTVLAWGRNHRGQLGSNSTEDQHEPAVVHQGDIVSVGAGNGISAAITADGGLLMWGRNSFGQLGLSPQGTAPAAGLSQVVPAQAQLPKGAQAAAVDAGQRHAAVVTKDGRLLLLGLDAQGRPQNGAVPLKSAWGRPLQVYAGEDFTLVLTSRRRLLAIGANASGQLGTGDRANRLTPAVVTLPGAEGDVTGVWAGARSAVAVTSAHEVYTWGDASAGQAGRGAAAPGNPDMYPTPQKVTALADARIVAASGGAYHVVLTAEHGPATALRVTPYRATAIPGEPVTYAVHAVDAFGTDLGPAPEAILSVSDGETTGSTVRAHTPGIHHVTARAGRLVGTALLNVTNGHQA